MTTRNDAKYAALSATYGGSLADMRGQWDAADIQQAIIDLASKWGITLS